MQLTIYIPKKDEQEVKSATKAAKCQDIGIGAYFINLHKADQERKARSFHE